MTENDKERIAKLLESGVSIGMIFSTDVDRLIEKNREKLALEYPKGAIEHVLDLHKFHFKSLGSAIIDGLYSSSTSPDLWCEFLSNLSNQVELMVTESKRIRKEMDEKKL